MTRIDVCPDDPPCTGLFCGEEQMPDTQPEPDPQPKRRSEADAELEREIRKERKFSLAEAIGRLAGPGMMKGVSPVTRKRQSEAEIEDYLKRHLVDASGILWIVLLRGVKGSDLLLNNLQQPLAALAGYIQQALGSKYVLEELVREADIEWARTFDERPYFQTEGVPADPADPYTIESVHLALIGLVEQLTAGQHKTVKPNEP